MPGVPGAPGILPLPSELTTRLCSGPLLFQPGFLESLIISLGVGTCHSLKTMNSNESQAHLTCGLSRHLAGT